MEGRTISHIKKPKAPLPVGRGAHVTRLYGLLADLSLLVKIYLFQDVYCLFPCYSGLQSLA